MNKSGHRKSLSPNVLNVKFPYQQARHSPLKIIDIFLKEKKSKEQNAYTEAEPTIVKNHRYSKLIEQDSKSTNKTDENPQKINSFFKRERNSYTKANNSLINNYSVNLKSIKSHKSLITRTKTPNDPTVFKSSISTKLPLDYSKKSKAEYLKNFFHYKKPSFQLFPSISKYNSNIEEFTFEDKSFDWLKKFQDEPNFVSLRF
jgi:hypothetical protein